MNFLVTIAIGIVAFLGGLIPGHFSHQTYDSGGKGNEITFGSTGYPAALDTTTLPNPNPTDSVATVSHSALHTNENDSIKAIEAKLGVGASTPTNSAILIGTGTGSSGWSTSPSLANLLVTGSSTLQNLTFVNATGSQATTTNFFSTNGTFTTASSTTANVGTATISNLTVTSCTGCSVSSAVLYVSTTSVQQLATTTVSLGTLQGKDNLRVQFYSPGLVGSATTSATVYMTFNSDIGVHYAAAGTALGNANFTNLNLIGTQLIQTDNAIFSARYANLTVFNGTTTPKLGSFTAGSYGTSTNAINNTQTGTFSWNNITSRITSIDFWTDKNATALFATGTQITVQAY